MYKIRNYKHDDANEIGKFDKIAELSYRYNPYFRSSNIFSVVDEEESILGVAHLEPDFDWALLEKGDLPFRLKYKISLNSKGKNIDNVRERLLEKLLLRAKEIKDKYPARKMRVTSWQDCEDKDEIDFHLTHGFTASRFCFVMKYDLTKHIPDVSKPNNIIVKENNLETEKELIQYYRTVYSVFLGETWGIDYLKWLKCGPEWCNFSAFYNDEIIANTMTWKISDERSATEEIFVLPEWRQQGICKYIITETLKDLKKKGKKCATLSVFTDNKPAISLYKSLGYKIHGVMLEMEYELQ